MKLNIFACVLSLLVLSGSTAQQRPKVTGFFTNMKYVEDAGDVVGAEVWIVSARGDFFACVQIAEGVPERPVVVPVEVNGSRIKFTIKEAVVDQNGNPAPDAVTDFEGTVTDAGLLLSSGLFSPTNNSTLLPRRNSYWQ